jgi:hydroxypyruvate reductase
MSIFLNYGELVRDEETNLRATVLEILEAGVNSVLPENAMREFFEKGGLDLPEKVTVFGWGKASVGMFKSFSENYDGEMLLGCIIAQHGDELQTEKGTIEISHGAHPIPDESSIYSGKKLLEIARGLSDEDTLVCLISGGGSSMFEVPKEGIDVYDLRRIYRMLLESGADIHEMNSIRRALSQNKGGGLAKAAHPARIMNLIISDVPGNNLEDISSGPTVLDPLKVHPKDVVEKYQMDERIDTKIMDFIQNYKAISEEYFKNVETQIIADNNKAIDAMIGKADNLGYRAIRYQKPVEGEAREAVNSFLKMEGDLIVGGGETTVTLTGSGKGGRNQEFVLSGLEKLDNGIIASMGTDGIDGNSEVAGAIGDAKVLLEAKRKGYDIDSFLVNNNSFEFFEKCGGLLRTGPTETNVADICVLLR